MSNAPLISVIIPMHNESAALGELFSRLCAVLKNITENYEIICIDDGSVDDTLSRLREINSTNPRIRSLSLSRNFGKEAALTAGIDASRGDAVIPFDADLQDPPELITQMVEKWREGFKVVLAVRNSRPGDSAFKRITAGAFYWLINRVATIKIPPNVGDFRLMDREVIEAVKKFTEHTRFMKGLFAWVGYKTAEIRYDRPARSQGSSSWNYRRLWGFALDGIFSFTTVPLRIWTYLGAIISLSAFIYAFYLIIRTLIFGGDVPGYPSLMVTILFIGGVQLMSLGILGEYIGRIYREVKHRPLYLVKESIGI